MPKQKSIQGKYSGILGQRYIFFSTLKNDNEQLYTNAAAHFKNLNNNFISKNEKDEDEVSDFILNMIKMLDSIAQHTKQNEINYLLQQRKKILESKDIEPELKKEVEKLIPNSVDAKWDYKTIILGLEKVRNKSSSYQEAMQNFAKSLQENKNQNIFNNTEWLNELYTYTNKKGEKVTKTYREWYLTAYNVYRQAVLDKFKKDYNVPVLITSLFEQKYNKILEECLQSEDFLRNLILYFQIHSNDQNPSTAIKELIVGIILNNPENTADKISKELIKQVHNYTEIKNLEQLLSDQAEKVFATDNKEDKKMSQSLEMMALETGQGLAEQILKYFQKREQYEKVFAKIADNDSELIKKYTLLLQNIRDIQNEAKGNLSAAKRELTIELRKGIFNNLRKKHKNKTTLVYERIRHNKNKETQKQQINKVLANYAQTYPVEDAFQKNLRISHIDASSWAELISSPKNLSILQNAFNHYVPGKPIPLKDDISFTASFELPSHNDFVSSKLLYEFNQEIEEFGESLSKIYYNDTTNDKQKGETDVAAAKEAYKTIYGDLAKKYNQIVEQFGKDSKEFKKFNDYLQNNFLGAVSVKEYQFYNNDLGFEGGSLGGSHNAIIGIENIYKMYDAGGLKPIDIDVIIEAALNCAPGMVARDTMPDLIENIKNYLIGGAAMMMFDEGFAMSKEFLQQLQAEFHTDLQLNHIFLYQFNTLYVPASYVIKNISENLKKFYNILEGERETFKTRSSIEFVNPITVNDIPSSETTPLAQDRWNEVSKKAQESVSIHVLLMAGLLDMFENLPELINPIA